MQNFMVITSLVQAITITARLQATVIFREWKFISRHRPAKTS
jgi:hypothetical protein